MAETGYVVNPSVRALVTRRPGAVAVVLSEPQERLFEDPNFSVLGKACSQRLAEADLSMVLMIAGSADERERVARYARAGHVDGALLISTHAGDPIFDELEAAGVPTVACGKPLEHETSIPYVGEPGAVRLRRSAAAGGVVHRRQLTWRRRTSATPCGGTSRRRAARR